MQNARKVGEVGMKVYRKLIRPVHCYPGQGYEPKTELVEKEEKWYPEEEREYLEEKYGYLNEGHFSDLIFEEKYEPYLLKEQEARWIPVTERLPKSMINRVLVYVQHEDLTGYVGFGHYEKYKGEEMWYDLENKCQFARRGYTVTHWMETPMPPMEGR